MVTTPGTGAWTGGLPAAQRLAAQGLSAALTSVLAYVKPCTVHSLSPAGIEAYGAVIVGVSSRLAEAIEIGEDVQSGRYQPGSGRLGALAASVVRDACTLYTPCPHDLALALIVYTAAYAAASRRGRVSRDTVQAAVMSVLAHTGERDAAELARVLEAVAPHDHMSLEEAVAGTPAGLGELAEALAARLPGYGCLARPSICLDLAAQVRNPHDPMEAVRLWTTRLLPSCAPELGTPSLEGERARVMKQLLAVDVECRRRGLHRRCERLVSVLAVAVYAAALLP